MSNSFFRLQLTVPSAAIWRGTVKQGAAAAGISLLAACTTVSTVGLRQDGHLSLTSRARNSFTSWSHVKNVGLKRATAYCNARNAQLHVVTVHTDSVWGVSNEMVEVVFDCF